MASWADMCEDEDEQDSRPWVQVPKRGVSSPQPAVVKPLEAKQEEPKEAPKGPLCYCGEPSNVDTVKKSGKHEKIGTTFVVCASGQCKYWFALPVPDDLPAVDCLCGKRAAACKVKNPESRHCGKYISSCAFGKCKFYKIH
jgi:hypothetical protein